MYQRNISDYLLEIMEDTPVAFIRGARQVGKTTLVKNVLPSAAYFTLDNATALSAAQADPAAFVSGGKPMVIDEVQKVPALLPAIKETVDRDRTPGRFVLTGSTDLKAMLQVSESLAGRMEVLDLWPLSLGELAGHRERFIERAFDPREAFRDLQAPPLDVFGHLLTGGYPEVVSRASEKRRRAWFDSYVTAILERDVRDLANIQDVTALPRLLQLLASRCASMLNYSELSRSLAMPQTTLKRYLALLEATFLCYEIPAWSRNMGKRLIKSGKLMLTDTGLASALLGFDAGRLENDDALRGALLENFVASELRKQATWSDRRIRIFHYRTLAGQEVDLVLEDAAGQVVGIEVKATRSPTAAHFKGLQVLQEDVGAPFVRGILLYNGPQVIPFGPRLLALPLALLAAPWPKTAGFSAKH